MIIYIDENLSPKLAKGLDILQKPEYPDIELRSIKEVFGAGTADEDWIPIAGAENACAITQDINIHRTRSQRELYEQYGMGFIFIKSPSNTGFKYWDMVQLLIKHWPQIAKKAQRTSRPFGFRLSSRSNLEPL